MNENTQETETTEEIVIDESTVAAGVLVSENSWDVLTQLYKETLSKIFTTQGFVVPVIQCLPTLRTKLTDVPAFEKSFNTLINDIQSLTERLNICYELHKDRSGEPTQEDWAITFGVSQEYSNISMKFDSTVAPLIFSLVEIIKNEHGDLLELPTNNEVIQ